MRFVVAAAIKDVRRRFADPAALAIWIGIPLLLGGLMSVIASGGGPPRARILLVDQDGTFVSRLLLNAGGPPAGSSLFDFEEVNLEDGRRRIAEGDATALLVVPQGFQDSVLRDRPSTIELVTNPAERILPGMAEEALDMLVEGVFYLQQLFGPTIRQIVDGPSSGSGSPSNAEVAALSIEINERLGALQGVLIPPAIQLEVKVEGPQDGEQLSFGQLFLPGILFMSFLFVAQGMSSDVWDEKARGTLRRALTTPQSASRLLAGKLAAGIVLMTVIGLGGLMSAIVFFDISWTRVPLATMWCAFAGATLIALMTLLQTLAGSQRGAEMLATLVVLPLMMLGGSFFPFEAMPAWMAAIGQWTPNGLAVVRLKELLYGHPSAEAMIVSALGIGIPGAIAFAVTARRLQGRFATS
jgi:ABC-type multidrug transport system permease subunit